MVDSNIWSAKLKLVHHTFTRTLKEKIGCGPFDGGCLIVAQAIHSIIGGEIGVLVDKDDEALHAVVLKDGQLWDYDGPMEPGPFLQRYNTYVDDPRYRCIGHRLLTGWDLSEAMEDNDLARHLAKMIAYILPSNLKTGSQQIAQIHRPDADHAVQQQERYLFR